jgi:hypothetical protein
MGPRSMDTLGCDEDVLLLLTVDRRRVRSEPSDDDALLALELSRVRVAGRGSGSCLVGVASAEDGLEPGIMFLSFSNNGIRMPKGEAGVAGVGARGVLSLSPTGVLSFAMERLLTDVSILLGGLGKSLAISESGSCNDGKWFCERGELGDWGGLFEDRYESSSAL